MQLEAVQARTDEVTLTQKIVLTAMNALIAPLLELTAANWSYDVERQSLQRSLERLLQRSETTPHQREQMEWRERLTNQRRSLRQLRMQLFERTQVWTGATYQPIDRLENSELLAALTAHTQEALELLDAFEQIYPDLRQRTVYSRMRVTLRCSCCFLFSSFSALKNTQS